MAFKIIEEKKIYKFINGPISKKFFKKNIMVLQSIFQKI